MTFPATEAARLAALRQFQILDTPPEPFFEEAARLAATLCAVPVALVAFMDVERQWFKANIGLPFQEMPRDIAFCVHAMKQDEMLVAQDTRRDPRFAANPLVTGEPFLRFYAGATLRTAEGAALGTLCVFDREPRRLAPEQRDALQALARLVMGHLETRRRVALQERLAMEANRAAKLKSEFVASVSHEFRSPLHGLIGATDLLLESDLTPEQQKLGAIAADSAQSLLRLVNDILEFSKIEARRMSLNPAPFDLRRKIEGTAARFALRAAAKGLKLTVSFAPDLPESVTGDAGRIQQIVTNLVDNAVKFTKSGTVRIEVRRESEAETPESRAGLIVIEVSDTGGGIAPEQIERVFEPFAQAGSAVSRQGGTGLGLSISRQMAALMRGSLTAVSEPGVGAIFRLTLPLPQSESADAKPPSVPRRHWPVGLRVLVADDDAVSRKIAALILGKMGCRTEEAASGTEALRKLESQNYDLILMDCQMLETDGYEAAREIRRREAETGRRTPVIALTASVALGAPERCLDAGMDAYLSKPLDREKLRGIALSLLPAPESEKELSETPPKPPAVPDALDRDAVLQRVGGNREALRSLAELFAAERTTLLAALRRAAVAQDREAFRGAAHKLRGVLMSLEAGPGIALVRRLEQSAAGDWPASAEPILRELTAELQRVRKTLTAMTRSGNAPKRTAKS